MQITLTKIDRENFDEVVKLDVHESQRSFVAPNVRSIAQSMVYEYFCPRAVYDGDTLVGFLMYGKDDESNGEVWLIRLMVDKNLQGRGYGKAATLKAVEEIRERFDPPEIFLSFEPENSLAKGLYEKLGFRDTGRVEYGELVYRLDLKNNSN